MKISQETFKFFDQELYELKAYFEAMEQELKDTRNDLTRALGQQDKYKEEGDDLLKLVECRKQMASENGIIRLLFLKVLVNILVHEVKNVMIGTTCIDLFSFFFFKC